MTTNKSATEHSTRIPNSTASMIDLVVQSSPDLTTVVTPEGTYLWVASSSSDLFACDANDMTGNAQEDFAHPDDAILLHDSRLAAMSGEGPVTVSYRFACGDGKYKWVEAICVRTSGLGPPLLICNLRDSEHRKASELVLQQQAFTDPLTGVANRAVFMDRLGHALKHLERREGIVSVLFLDLDRFKVINDSMGHRMGDGVLMSLAERLLGVVRPADTLARLGGDEFAIILEDISSNNAAVNLGNRIIEEGRKPFKVGEEEFVCTMSVGVAQTADPQHSAEDLLKEADLALYRAKDRGRDRAESFDEDLRVRAAGRMGTERMLRTAIVEDRLLLHFQPVVDLQTGRTVAVESLVRVLDLDRGPLIAESFIQVAEESGLLPTMDRWVFDKALEQASSWQKTFSGTDFDDIAVNVTARNLADADFGQTVLDSLGQRELPASCLQIEITERVLMEASNSAMSGLRTLRAAGVKVGLDDFGTGYSSLSALRHLPLDFVKIDRSFIHEMTKGGPEHAIVSSIIGLCHALDMLVVGEGIETTQELELLVALGCDRGQGFLFAEAGEAGIIESLVLKEATPVRKSVVAFS